jgi:hypothetical protein
MNPFRILAEKRLGKEPLERQSWEISIRTDLRGISRTDKKWVELGRLGPLPSDLQALLPYHRAEYANTEFFFFNAGLCSSEHCGIWDVIDGCAGTMSSSARRAVS